VREGERGDERRSGDEREENERRSGEEKERERAKERRSERRGRAEKREENERRSGGEESYAREETHHGAALGSRMRGERHRPFLHSSIHSSIPSSSVLHPCCIRVELESALPHPLVSAIAVCRSRHRDAHARDGVETGVATGVETGVKLVHSPRPSRSPALLSKRATRWKGGTPPLTTATDSKPRSRGVEAPPSPRDPPAL